MRLLKEAAMPARLVGACAGGRDGGAPRDETATKMVEGRLPTRETLGMLLSSSCSSFPLVYEGSDGLPDETNSRTKLQQRYTQSVH